MSNPMEQLPQTLASAEIERLALASGIMSEKNLFLLAQQLKMTDFTVPEYQQIFFILSQIYKEAIAVSLGVVCEKVKAQNMLDLVGGMQKLVLTLTTYTSSVDIESYVEFLKERSGRRKLSELSQRLLTGLREFDKPVSSVIESVKEELYLIENRLTQTEIKSVSSALASDNSGKSYVVSFEERQERRRKGEIITGISTGYASIDRIIGGLEDGNLILLAARPGMGKTTLALNIYEEVAYRQLIPTLFIPLEMSTNDILDKIISSNCEIDYRGIRDASLNPIEFQKIVSFVSKNNKAYLTEKSEFRLPQLRNIALRAKDTHGIKLLIIDYLQLIHGSSRTKNDSKYQEISEISIGLKTLARELNIPIICLSQLSRKVEERQDQIPQLSDLRDSGSLEADADIVMFLYRFDHKDKFNRPGQAKLIIAKNRRGETGEVLLSHNFGKSSFNEQKAYDSQSQS